MTAPRGLPLSIRLVPKTKLYPNATQMMLTTATMTRLCITMLSTFFCRTSPP